MGILSWWKKNKPNRIAGSAILLANSGKYTEALQKAEEALSLDPDTEMAWATKAISYFNTDQPEASLEACKKVLAINPQSSLKDSMVKLMEASAQKLASAGKA